MFHSATLTAVQFAGFEQGRALALRAEDGETIAILLPPTKELGLADPGRSTPQPVAVDVVAIEDPAGIPSETELEALAKRYRDAMKTN